MVNTAHKHQGFFRPSGVEWLGEVPLDWTIKKMKYLFRDHSQKGKPNAELLSVTQNRGVVPRAWVENRMVMPTGGLDSFKFIKKGEFAISLRSFEGGLEYCHHDGIISPAYTVLKAWHADLDPGYYRHLFKSSAFISELQTSVVGIRDGKNISFGELACSMMPIPPLREQRAITAFLDEKCAKVDEAVRIKEEQIALLRERRRILVQQAVTRGLNPIAHKKDSGIDWIGHIPAHWDVMSIRNAFKFRNNQRIPLSASEREGKQGEYPYYGASGIIDYVQDYIFDEDLILIAEDGANLLSKSTPLAFVATGKYWVNNHAHILQPLFPGFKYWAELLSATDYTVYISGAAQPKLTKDRLGSVRIPVPPAQELLGIISFIERVSEKFTHIISIKEDQIVALKDYKTSLINAAVTGKIKVSQ